MTLLPKQFHKVRLHLEQNRGEYLLLTLIILVATYFRFVNAFNRYSTGYESIRDYIVAYVGSTQAQLPLTGPFSSLGHFTFGPWYWYGLIGFNALFPHNYSPWILIGLLSVGQVLLMYQIGKELGGKSLGITVAILAALAGYLVDTVTSLSNPNPIHFLSALALWLFLKALKPKASNWWLFSLGFVLGVGFFTHYQMLAYLILPVCIFVVKKFRLRYLFWTGLGVFISYLPMLFFDLLNQWHMLRNIIFAYTDMGNRIYVPNSWRIYLFDFWPLAWKSLWHLPTYVSIATMILVAGLCGFAVVKRRVTWKMWLMIIIFVIVFVHLRYYKGERFMGYVHYTFPFLILFTGLAISATKYLWYGKYLFPLVLVATTGLMLPEAIASTAPDEYAAEFRRLGQSAKQKYPQEGFRVYHCTKEGSSDMSLSFLFVLKTQNMLDDSGRAISSGKSNCLSMMKPEDYSLVYLIDHAHTGPLVFFSETAAEKLDVYGFEPYNLEGLYHLYALWWFEPTI